ncbi:MAG: tRNA 2-thiouridine(34) synthase MnmA [Desulfomonilaceae bacterium]
MKIAIAMSGGMDSTAAALILKRKGYDVLGLHARLHSDSDRTWSLARIAAHEISVPIQLVDLSTEFSDLVINHFVLEYARGRTPSPCLRCNRFIKADLLFERALELGCSKFATGHYARILKTEDGWGIFRGTDTEKDQSYFLSMLKRESLGKTLFPLGEMTKAHVKAFLKNERISVGDSPESQEICFIPDRDYRGFLLKQGVDAKPGQIINLQGKLLGKHEGIIGYTIGQRRGLGICGPEPLYVTRIDASSNTIVVGTRKETLCWTLRISRLSLLTSAIPAIGNKFDIKIRSTAKPVRCTVIARHGEALDVEFDRPQSGVSPGQATCLYLGDRVIGGGWIESGE